MSEEIQIHEDEEQLPEPIKGNLPQKPPDKFCNGRNKLHTRYCRNPAGYKTDHFGQGRCSFHGGKSKRGIHHYNFKTGKYCEVMPDHLVEHYEKLMEDGDLLSLREDVGVMTSLVMDAFRDMKENYYSSVQYFKLMKRGFQELDLLLKSYSDEVPDSLVNKLNEIKFTFMEAQSEHHKKSELMNMMDQKRKLAESERKRLLEAHQLFSAEQMMTVMAAVLSIIRENVPDMQAQERIAGGIRMLINRSQKQIGDEK